MKKAKELKYIRHAASQMFPDLSEKELTELELDILTNGQRIPIDIMPDGISIVDGWNRYLVCHRNNIKPKFRMLPRGTCPFRWAMSANVMRRHLSTAQRSMIGAKVTTFTHGGERPTKWENPNIPAEKGGKCGIPHLDDKDEIRPVGQAEAAQKMNVSRDSVRQAQRIRQQGDLAAAVEAGEMSLNAAVKEVEKREAKAAEPPTDRHGHEIPKRLRETWTRIPELKGLIQKLQTIAKTIADAKDGRDELYAYVHAQQIAGDLNNAVVHLRRAIPYCLCPVCGGDGGECQHCRAAGERRGKGWCNRPVYDIVPAELKSNDKPGADE